MSRTHTADGRRLSSMTHAKHGHVCGICGRMVFGNGGQVSHGRGHVRRGEAVELVKHFGYGGTTMRVFVAAPGVAEVYRARGFEEES